MAIALTKRRVVAVKMETTRGTFNAPASGTDDLPTIREATFTPSPVQVERPTLRLSLTPYPATFPGVATVELRFTVELGGRETNPQADYAVPNWGDCLRACGFTEVSNANGGAKPRILSGVASPLTGTDTNGVPIRHGAALAGNGATTPGVAVAIGDFYNEDDILIVQETTAPVGAFSTWTQTIGGLTKIATGTRPNANSVVAFKLNSDVNTTETVSLDLYIDGKRLRAKGCMGNAEILLDHGDMIRAQFTFQGIVDTYGDQTMPTAPFELHKVAPTFLGKEVRFYEIASSATALGYGRDSGTFINDPETTNRTTIGAVNQMRIATGNNVILRENSFDPSGVSFALITGRAPTGSFNPDEVLNTEFPWVTKFINGTPIRFKAMVGKPGSETTAQDGNTIDVLAPGIQISSFADGDRDGIHAWNGQFRCTGGDYDSSASGELPGNDNELTLIYR